MVLNPETGNVSPKLQVVFDNEFSAAPFMTEGTLTPNLKYLVQYSSQIVAPENIYLKYARFAPNFEYDPRKTPRHELIIVPNAENKNNTIESYPPKQNIHEGTSSEGACTSDSQKHPV